VSFAEHGAERTEDIRDALLAQQAATVEKRAVAIVAKLNGSTRVASAR
jgi:hypothetical protein